MAGKRGETPVYKLDSMKECKTMEDHARAGAQGRGSAGEMQAAAGVREGTYQRKSPDSSSVKVMEPIAGPPICGVSLSTYSDVSPVRVKVSGPLTNPRSHSTLHWVLPLLPVTKRGTRKTCSGALCWRST